MEHPYSIDLVDAFSGKIRLGTIRSDNVHWEQENNEPVRIDGVLRFSPQDKQIYLKTASMLGDTLKLWVSDEINTLSGMFQLSFFDPSSNRATFHSVGEVEITVATTL